MCRAPVVVGRVLVATEPAPVVAGLALVAMGWVSEGRGYSHWLPFISFNADLLLQ